jgi:hypothetical protein
MQEDFEEKNFLRGRGKTKSAVDAEELLGFNALICNLKA